MMYDPMELIGRYVLTGIILWAAAAFLIGIRMAWIGSKYCSGIMSYVVKIDKIVEGYPEPKKLQKIVETVLWPYGIVKFIVTYMRLEIRILHETESK